MKILLGSHFFFPSTGGIETVTGLLARAFVRRGHEVRVVTQSEGAGDFPFPVVRRPSASTLLEQVRWCDVFLQNNISLRTLWPLLLVRRPLFITHQTWIANPDGTKGWLHRLKMLVLRRAENFAISRAIASRLAVPALTIGNPYDDEVFKVENGTGRDGLIFVGRLVSDKGADTLLDALGILRTAQMEPRLTIVGDGPERGALEQQAAALGLTVDFRGAVSGAELAGLLNKYLILVVPSRWAEPFGIVALEAIACGCVVVGSAEGGLVEAIGPCGVTFPNGDARALAEVLRGLLNNPERVAARRAGAAAHLARFSAEHVADLYLEAMSARVS